jgi:hypothetical protein
MFKWLQVSHGQASDFVQNAPDFRVAHESLLESDSETVSLERDKVVLVTNGIHVLSLAVEDSVSLLIVGKTPTIVHAACQKYAFFKSEGSSHQADLL